MCLSENMGEVELSEADIEEDRRRQPAPITAEYQPSAQAALQRGRSVRASLVTQLGRRN